jgi:glucose-1-phosphate cytidylyltransferase
MICLRGTYGDGVAQLDLRELVRFHRQHGQGDRRALVVPFGILDLGGGGHVQRFREKPDNKMGWTNGGIFVCEPSVFDYIDGDDSSWERAPLERLAAEGELMAYSHKGFWHAIDTLRVKRELEKLWANGKAI